jgi:uncharacterized protein (TIGR03083 family)
MTELSYDRYCDEIVTQAGLLRAAIEGADLTAPVPSCPGWNAGQLVRHVGGAHRWAAEAVRRRVAEPFTEQFRDLSEFTSEDPAVAGPWLAEGAAALAAVLREAGPGAPMWTPVPGGSTDFYARRFTHETAVHRADGTLALGRPYLLDPVIAIDGIDEWMELGSLPMHFDMHPQMRELIGPGRTVHLHATDTAPEAAAEWVVDLTGEQIAWRRAHEKAAVAVRGPLTDLLLLVYKRRPARGAGIEVLGDAGLLDFWLERVSFG